MEKLADDFVPGAFDVICSRGKAAYQHRGNRSFRATLEHHLHSYAHARSKQEKTEIVSLIYNGIQEATPEGGFIRKNEKGDWCRVPNHVAREKVGQGFRDLLHTEYRSSTKAKIKRRRERLYPPIKPPELEEDEGHKKQSARSPGESNKAHAENSEKSGNRAPAVNNGKISKSFSYDSDPLPIEGANQNNMSILSQCSFSFITPEEAAAQSTERPRLEDPTPEGASYSPHRLQWNRSGATSSFGGQHELGSQSSGNVASLPRSPGPVTPQLSDRFGPLAQVENHRTWPIPQTLPPPYPYYQQHHGSHYPRDGYDYRGATRAWSEDEAQRRKGYYHRFY